MGLLFVTVAGLDGVARDCLLLASIMPAAVINFVFAEKYGKEAGSVATAVAVSTAVSLVTTPLLLAYGL
jgi:predicted permease